MRILLVKLNHIGDTLLLTPTIRWLRQRFPESRIDVVVRKGCEGILAGNPDINQVLAMARPEKAQRTRADSRENRRLAWRLLFSSRYDFAFDLSNSDRAKWLVLLSRARVRGINDWHAELGGKRRLFNAFSHFAWGRAHQVLRDFRTVADIVAERSSEPPAADSAAGPLVFEPSVSTAQLADALPALRVGQPFIVLHPASRWAFKEWLAERWAGLADALSSRGYQIVLSAGPDAREREICATIAAQMQRAAVLTDGRLSLAQLGRLLGEARLYLGIDTSVMHLAAAMQTPSVVLFGPSSEWSWRPWQVSQQLVLGDCECKRTREFVCDKTTIMPCMAGIQVDSVLTACNALLDDLVQNSNTRENIPENIRANRQDFE